MIHGILFNSGDSYNDFIFCCGYLIYLGPTKSKIKFSDSFLVTFKNLFYDKFFLNYLFLGVIFTFSLFEFLFFTIKMDWFFIALSLSFVYSLYFIFNIHSRLFSTEPESINEERTVEQSVHMPKFLHHLISYILIPVMAILTGIIVVYILINLRGKFLRKISWKVCY